MVLIALALHRRALVSTALAVLVAALVLLPLLGHKPLAEWDEAIYAEAAREMLGGSWLIPHWNGALWLEKPPLMLWITAIFYKLFGINELAARFGSALSGVAIVGLLHGWLARRRDRLTAWLSTVILLSTFGFLHVCHVGEMDVLLSLGACIALIGLVEIDELRPRGWLWFSLGFAIAVMTKGAAAIVIPVAALVYALIQRWRPRHFGRFFVLGAAGFLVAVLPWHLAMYHRYGHEFFAQYLGLQVLHRAAVQMEGHHTHWWYYLIVLAVSAPPFCLLFPAAIARGLRSAEMRVWALFALAVLVLFSLAQTRLPHYIAPAYPALALLSAVWLGEFVKARLILSIEARPTNSAHGKWRALAPALLAAALIWPASILLTHRTLKSLHSASLAGPGLLDNRDADALLRRTPLPAVEGPLLYLRDGRVQSIASVVFYARRPVQQVVLTPPDPTTARDRYTFDPISISQGAAVAPRLILLDRTLMPQLPPSMEFTPVAARGGMVLGVLAPEKKRAGGP